MTIYVIISFALFIIYIKTSLHTFITYKTLITASACPLRCKLLLFFDKALLTYYHFLVPFAEAKYPVLNNKNFVLSTQFMFHNHKIFSLMLWFFFFINLPIYLHVMLYLMPFALWVQSPLEGMDYYLLLFSLFT